MRALLVCTAVVLVLSLSSNDEAYAQRVLHVETQPGMHLEARVEHARRIARTAGASRTAGSSGASGASAWIGYSFERMLAPGVVHGMFYETGTRRPTLEELVNGTRSSSATEDTLPGGAAENVEPVLRRVAVLIHLDTDHRVDGIRLVTMNSVLDAPSESLYWLGATSADESFDFVLRYLDAERPSGVRKGAIWALGGHGTPSRIVPLLSEIVRDDTESTEIRKAAIYSLGNQDSHEARSILTALVYEATQ